jgi:hypothetical protein
LKLDDSDRVEISGGLGQSVEGRYFHAALMRRAHQPGTLNENLCTLVPRRPAIVPIWLVIRLFFRGLPPDAHRAAASH